ncbi:hypothetical protein P7K49_037813 [Saguinus oedipus]|uniref:Uncharacterized protein n=1 Tax=Saguinus oedipus TaxID=9490 RepID=A0ABQ9TJM3_SAGOE|nr:hypothetical protein P7K49_037813 [Saguinus oedipus]
MKILDDPKVSSENFMSHRMMSLHQPKVQTTPEPFHDDIPTGSVHSTWLKTFHGDGVRMKSKFPKVLMVPIKLRRELHLYSLRVASPRP